MANLSFNVTHVGVLSDLPVLYHEYGGGASDLQRQSSQRGSGSKGTHISVGRVMAYEYPGSKRINCTFTILLGDIAHSSSLTRPPVSAAAKRARRLGLTSERKTESRVHKARSVVSERSRYRVQRSHLRPASVSHETEPDHSPPMRTSPRATVYVLTRQL